MSWKASAMRAEKSKMLDTASGNTQWKVYRSPQETMPCWDGEKISFPITKVSCQCWCFLESCWKHDEPTGIVTNPQNRGTGKQSLTRIKDSSNQSHQIRTEKAVHVQCFVLQTTSGVCCSNRVGGVWQKARSVSHDRGRAKRQWRLHRYDEL